MTNANKLLKSSLIMFAISIAVALLSYVTNIIIIRNFSDAEYGSLAKIIIYSGIAGLFISYESNSLAQKIFLKNKKSISDTLNLIHSVRILNLSMVLIASTLFAQGQPNLELIVFLAYLLPTLNFSYAFEAIEINTVYSKIFLLERVFYFIVILLIITYLKNILQIIAIAVGVSSILSLLIQVKFIGARFELKLPKIKSVIEVYKDNFYLVGNAYALFGFGSISRIIIGIKVGDAGLGVYSFCWQIVGLSTMISAIGQKLIRIKLHEYLACGDVERAKKVTFTCFLIVISLMVIGDAFVYLFQDSILELIKRENNLEIIYLIYIFSLYMLIAALDVFSEILSVEFKIYKGIYFNIIACAIFISIIWFIDSKSLIIFAGVVTAGQFISSLMSFYITLKNIKNLKRN